MATIQLKINADSKQAQKAMRDFDKSTESLEQTFEGLKKSLTTKEIERYQNRLGKIKNTYSVLGEGAQGLIKQKAFLRSELIKLGNKGIKPTDVRMVALRTEYEKLKTSTTKLKASNTSLTSSFGNVAKLSTGIVAGFYAVRGAVSSLQGAYRASRDFSNEIKNVQTLTNELSFDEIKQQIKSLDPILGSAAELTNGLYQAISAGAEPASAIKLVGSAAKFAKAGLTSTSQSVNVLTTVLNAYGEEAYSVEEASDLLFNTIKQGKITGDELANTIGQAIPVFADAGVGLDQLTSGLATLTVVNGNASESTTQLRALAVSFLKPSTALAKAINEQGYASGSALLKTKGLTGALELLKKETKENGAEMVDLLPNIRALTGASTLLAQEGKLYADTLETMKDSSGSVEAAFVSQIDEIDKMQARIQNAKEKFGEFVETLLVGVSPAVEKIASIFAGLDFKSVAIGVGVAATAFGVMKGVMFAATITTQGFAAALASTGIGLIPVLVGAATVAIIKLIQNWDKVKLAMKKYFIEVKYGFLISGESIKKLAKPFYSLGLLIEKIILKFREFKNSLIEDLSNSGLGKILEKLGVPVDALSKKLKTSQSVIEENKKRILEYEKSFKDLDKTAAKGIEKRRKELEKEREGIEAATKALEKKTEQTIASTVASSNALATSTGKATNKPSDDFAEVYDVPPAGGGAESVDTTSIEKQIAKHTEFQNSLRQTANEVKGLLSQTQTGVENISAGFIDSYVIATDIIKNKTITTAEKLKSGFSTAFTSMSSIAKGIGTIITNNYRNELQKQEQANKKFLKNRKKAIEDEKATKLKQIETERNAKILQLENLNLSEEEKELRTREIEDNAIVMRETAEAEAEARKKEVEKEAALKSYEIKLKAFNTDKAVKIAEAVLNAAAAVVLAYAQLGPIAGLASALVLGAVTGFQIDQIRKQQPPPPPSFAVGTGTRGFTVPQGFENDDYLIQARTGENVVIQNEAERTSSMMNISIYLGTRLIYKDIQRAINNNQIVVRV